MSKVRILAEKEDFLVVYKPAGLAVQTAALTGDDIEHFLKREGKTVLAPVNRLDQPVEGLVLFAKNSKAAAFLSAQLSDGRMEKEYLAACDGLPKENYAEAVDYLLTDKRTNLSKTVPPGTKGAKKAVLSYTLLETQEDISLLKVRLVTGRHHQIRCQLANLKLPICGDMKYNTYFKGKGFPALCAFRLSFIDPGSKKKVSFSVSPENPVFERFHYFTGEEPRL